LTLNIHIMSQYVTFMFKNLTGRILKKSLFKNQIRNQFLK